MHLAAHHQQLPTQDPASQNMAALQEISTQQICAAALALPKHQISLVRPQTAPSVFLTCCPVRAAEAQVSVEGLPSDVNVVKSFPQYDKITYHG